MGWDGLEVPLKKPEEERFVQVGGFVELPTSTDRSWIFSSPYSVRKSSHVLPNRFCQLVALASCLARRVLRLESRVRRTVLDWALS